MSRILTSISLIILTSIATKIDLPLHAGGCNSHKNKNSEVECLPNDEECIQHKSEKNTNNFEV
tara:strand:- start:4438 stop:4626 length:189 start_codon:yes stop_codon:yes gene_type:complete